MREKTRLFLRPVITPKIYVNILYEYKNFAPEKKSIYNFFHVVPNNSTDLNNWAA